MTPEIRRAALRAAAKVALVAAVGCGGKPPPPSNTTPPVQTDTVATCKEYLAGLKVVQRGELPVGDPLREKPDVYGAFADRAARETPRTKDCCNQEITANDQTHQWPCCSALDNIVPAGAIGCSPWGPPCPPEMVSPGARATA